jgi:hypothetical protein
MRAGRTKSSHQSTGEYTAKRYGPNVTEKRTSQNWCTTFFPQIASNIVGIRSNLTNVPCATEKWRLGITSCVATSKVGDWRSKCLRNIGLLKCENLRTHRGLYALLIRGLQALFKGEDRLTAEGYNQELTTLVYSQNVIGWGQLFNGRWSIHLSLIQGNYMGDDITQHRSPLGDRWNAAIIQDLWDRWHELWLDSAQ